MGSAPGQAKASVGMLGALSMAGLAFQVGVQPLVHQSCGSSDISPSLYVLLIEFFKFAICVTGMVTSRHNLPKFSLNESLRVAALPATTYAIQNMLMQKAYYHVDPLTLNVIVQCKLPLTAVLLYISMGQKQTKLQIVALIMLAIAGLLITYDPQSNDGENGGNNSFADGILPLLASCVLSAISAALCQVTLQGKGRDSYLFTMELGAYGSLTVISRLYYEGFFSMSFQEISKGFSWWVLLPAQIYATGGIMAGMVTKHAGAVQKSISIALGSLITAILKFWLFQSPLYARHYMALALLIPGTYIHSTCGPKKTKKEEKKE